MGWNYDRDKVRSQIDEFKTFLGHARYDEPADLSDLVGRPFSVPRAAEPEPPAKPAVQVNVNFYLLQLNQMYEAGLIEEEEYVQIRRRLYG